MIHQGLNQETAYKPAATTLHWHVVYTKPRQEFRAQDNLQNQGFEVFCPTIAIERRHNGRLHMVNEALFSRYVFVRFDQATSPWHLIRNTFGVTGLVKIGTQPALIDDSTIHALQTLGHAPVDLYQQGDPVHVIDGPLRGLEGVFEQKDGIVRAMILIEMLNKTQRIKLPLDAIAPGYRF